MLTPQIVNSILAPYDLELTDGGMRVKSMKYEFGTVGMEAIYEGMFLHNLSRDKALTDIAMLLNTASPEKARVKGKKKKVVNA